VGSNELAGSVFSGWEVQAACSAVGSNDIARQVLLEKASQRREVSDGGSRVWSCLPARSSRSFRLSCTMQMNRLFYIDMEMLHAREMVLQH
jgi:hypothetical protein